MKSNDACSDERDALVLGRVVVKGWVLASVMILGAFLLGALTVALPIKLKADEASIWYSHWRPLWYGAVCPGFVIASLYGVRAFLARVSGKMTTTEKPE